jgi:hypothetical protein
MEAFRDRSEGARNQLLYSKTAQVEISEMKEMIAGIESEVGAVGELRVDISGLRVCQKSCPPIARQVPQCFEELRANRWALLWRCDNANTLTFIPDTESNVFDHFALVKWHSRSHDGLRRQVTFKSECLKKVIFTAFDLMGASV